MLKKKVFSGRLKLFSVIGILALLYTGFTWMGAGSAASRLQDEPVLLQVPVVRQSTSTSCGEAVIAMTYNYAYPDTPISEQGVIEYAIAEGYYTPDLPPWTSPANMVKIAEYYADDVSSGTVISSGQGLALLIEKLRNGDPVIIDVLSNFADPESEAHFVLVTGVSVDPNRGNAVVIHYNDPLTGTQAADDWAGSAGVWNAWQNNDDPGGAGWWMVIPTPWGVSK